MPEPVLNRLAQAVASRVDRGFRFTWDPSWLKGGSPHQWSEDGLAYARCTSCLAVSLETCSAEAALDWYLNHAAAAHRE